ncbi:MAG: D-alanyl-D-alanine carboxypeptidase [Magnetococcales bacterium]|nr:D-alanyl-D-alanine carboxypeptidase [Magnetococcales bacterium]MBF0323182.1 D-alanyl-D-alanine carboxypeptidase [Magnetococcales bacterium]
MLPTCCRTGTARILFILLVLAGVFGPFSTYAADERQQLSAAHVQKVSLQKLTHKSKKLGKKHVSKTKQRSKNARHARAVVDPAANYADLVIDARTGRILHATSPDELRHPASLTKMMTLYLAFDALKRGQLRLDQQLPISPNAANQEPSKLGLKVGRQIRVEDALLGLVTKSANDATVVLAEAMGQSEDGFVRLMNDKARDLGMTHTVFRNSSGLPDPDQVSTARDMAVLGYALIYHHPQFYPYFSREAFTYAGVHHNNHNHLMSRYQGMDGIKTGYTRASGFNLVGSTVRGSTRLIAVVFGGRSAVARDNRVEALLDQAFAQLQSERSFQQVASVRGNAAGTTPGRVAVPLKAPVNAGPRQSVPGKFDNS